MPIMSRAASVEETSCSRRKESYCYLFFTLRYDSHFWWQRNENGLSHGIAEGMSRGRDMNVFSMMSALIYTVVVGLRAASRA